MDRAISEKEKRKDRVKLILRITLISILLLGVIVFLKIFLKGSLSQTGLHVGKVDRGVIEVTVNASGRLTPLLEEIIISPINSRILEVYKSPGDSVNKGDALMKLDISSLETDYFKLLDEKEMKKRQLIQVEINLNNTVSELEMNQQIKEMQLRQLNSDLKSEIYLDSIGASTPDKIRKAELSYEEAKLELEQLDKKIQNTKKHSVAELQVQELELNIFEKTLEENRKLLNDARILSPQDAILTYINNELGARVNEGTRLATISNLSSFKVNAEIADGHAEKLSLGGVAIVRLGESQLKGSIVNITPSSENGVINFTVLLEDASNPGLRSGLRVDVNVLYGLKSNVLRLPYGSFFNYGRGEYDLWVINNGKAEKRKVKLGDSSFEYIEIIEGLDENEQVILSDMSSYKHKKTIKIK